MIYESYSEEDTRKIAYDMAKRAKPGEVYCLSGDLGTGKTAFAKGFAQGLDIKKHVLSPTFTIVNEYYDGRVPLYHFDVYRIDSLERMADTGYEEYFYGDGICLIEWAALIKPLLPKQTKEITIEKDYEKGEDYRLIKLL